MHLPEPNQPPSSAFVATAPAAPTDLWHRRLGHPGHGALSKLASSSSILCNRGVFESVCHACQLGRHTHLPFASSTSRALKNLDLIHCDLWTSPVASVSGYKYYLVILDDCSHYLWIFPLSLKSETFTTLANFFSYMSTQFGCTVKSVQCDNGKEFDNSSTRTFFLTHRVLLRMSCPYTPSQNGKAERIIRSSNNVIRCLLLQASLPPWYWVEALHAATHLLDRLPTKTLAFGTPTLLSLAASQITRTCEFLAAHATRTFQPQHPTSCLLLLVASSWGTLPTTKVTCVSTLILTKFTSHVLMSLPSPLQGTPLQLTLMNFSFLLCL